MIRSANFAIPWALGLLCGVALAGDPGAASLKPLDDDDWNREAAAHLLRRAAFGGSPREVDEFARMSLNEAVARLVDYGAIAWSVAPPLIDDDLLEPPERGELRRLTQEERQKYIQQRQMNERRAIEETRLWWLERMATSPRPFEEKMTLFWHGLLTSGIREVKRAVFIKEQNEFLRDHALGNFRDLLLGISKDRAMLVYLDNARNNKAKPNENYARELMELFSLGVGNYTEDDIKAAARAFTGWNFNRDGFAFNRGNHDYGQKTFLKQTGAWDGDDIVDIILKQPACSRHLARKMLEFFVCRDPDKALIEALAAEIRRQDFELRPVFRTLFKSRAFYAASCRGAIVKSPVEVVVGTARQLDLPLRNLVAAERATTIMGQELFQPPNVKGWDGGQKWINTATLFARYNYVSSLLNSFNGFEVPRYLAKGSAANDQVPDSGGEMMMDSTHGKARSRLENVRQGTFDPLPLLKERDLHDADQVVDFFAAHLLAVPLSTEKREALVGYLLDGSNKFDPAARGAAARVRTMVSLLCSSPEFQLE